MTALYKRVDHVVLRMIAAKQTAFWMEIHALCARYSGARRPIDREAAVVMSGR
ncbi:MAG TPA: hypothetical protein VFB96_08010 [Pirellulaceae bacterium]|nr:hypothetical protein [Pirellulaceae bacterium]